MKNILLITEEEKLRILNLHKKAINESLNEGEDKTIKLAQFILKNYHKKDLGTSGPNRDGIDGRYGKSTKNAILSFQKDKNIPQTGILDTQTKNAMKLSSYEKVYNKFTGGKEEQKLTKDAEKYKDSSNCTAIDQSFCSKISSTKETSIGNGGGEGCSEYVRKSLGFKLGNAWQAFNTAKTKGSVLYNMFTDGSINWNKVYNDSKFVNSTICSCHIEEGEGKDKKCTKEGADLPNKISSLYPSSSNVSLSSMKVGDIVGMYYKESGNKGKAFCQRAVENRGLDPNGKFTSKDPFTFNTHVGYVGAVKNGVPIIFHSVHGERLATPGTQLLSKNGTAMITWVVSSGMKPDSKTGEGSNYDKEEFVWYKPSTWFE